MATTVTFGLAVCCLMVCCSNGVAGVPLLDASKLENDNGETGPLVALTMPIHLQPLDGVRTYEGIVPMAFDLDIGGIFSELLLYETVSITKKSDCANISNEHVYEESPNGEIRMKNSTLGLKCRGEEDDIDYQLRKERANPVLAELKGLLKPEKDARRQAAAITALIAGALGEKWLSSIFGSTSEFSGHYRWLESRVHEDRKYFIQMEKRQAAFNTQTEKALESAGTKILSLARGESTLEKKIAQETYERELDFHFGTLVSAVKTTLLQCTTRHTPYFAIGHEAFKERLISYQKELNNNGKELVFDTHEQGHYYTLQHADCMFSKKRLHVVLQIPYRAIGQEFTLSRVVILPFRFHSEVCSIRMEQTIIAQSGNEFLTISGIDLEKCDTFSQKMCLVNPYQNTGQTSKACIRGILDQELVQEIQPKCPFNCYKESMILTTMLNSSTVLITNADEVEFDCGGNKTTTHVDKRHSLTVSLVHGCKMLAKNAYGDEALLPEPFFFQSTNATRPSVMPAFPYMWSSKLATHRPAVVEDDGSVFDKDWKLHVPTYDNSNDTLTDDDMDGINQKIDFWVLLLGCIIILCTMFLLAIAMVIYFKVIR